MYQISWKHEFTHAKTNHFSPHQLGGVHQSRGTRVCRQQTSIIAPSSIIKVFFLHIFKSNFCDKQRTDCRTTSPTFMILEIKSQYIILTSSTSKYLNRIQFDIPSESLQSDKAYKPVNVIFAVGGKIIIDDQGHLLHINSSGKQIGRDKYTAGA